MTMLPMDHVFFGIKKKKDLDEIVEHSLRQAAIWDELRIV